MRLLFQALCGLALTAVVVGTNLDVAGSNCKYRQMTSHANGGKKELSMGGIQIGEVYLLKEVPGSRPCTKGQTFGIKGNKQKMWVKNNCNGHFLACPTSGKEKDCDFKIINSNGKNGKVFATTSVNNVADVDVLVQLGGGNKCTQGKFGRTGNKIWARDGCHALLRACPTQVNINTNANANANTNTAGDNVEFDNLFDDANVGDCKMKRISSDNSGEKTSKSVGQSVEDVFLLAEKSDSKGCGANGDYGANDDKIFARNGCKGLFLGCPENEFDGCDYKFVVSEGGNQKVKQTVTKFNKIHTVEVVKETKTSAGCGSGRFGKEGNNKVYTKQGCQAVIRACPEGVPDTTKADTQTQDDADTGGAFDDSNVGDCKFKKIFSDDSGEKTRKSLEGITSFDDVYLMHETGSSRGCTKDQDFGHSNDKLWARNGCKGYFLGCPPGKYDACDYKLIFSEGGNQKFRATITKFNKVGTVELVKEAITSSGCGNGKFGKEGNSKIYAKGGCKGVFRACPAGVEDTDNTPGDGGDDNGEFCLIKEVKTNGNSKNWETFDEFEAIDSMTKEGNELPGSQGCEFLRSFGFWGQKVYVSKKCKANFRICGKKAEPITNKCLAMDIKTDNKWKKWRFVKDIDKIGYMAVKPGQAGTGGCKKPQNFGYLGNLIYATRDCKATFVVCREEPKGDVNVEEEDVEDKEEEEHDEEKQNNAKGVLKDLFGGDLPFEELIKKLKKKKRELFKDVCVCKNWGDPHYEMADGGTIHFMGICEYVVVQTTRETGPCKFKVTTQNEHRKGMTQVSFIRRVNIFMHGQEISFAGNTLLINNQAREEDVIKMDEGSAQYVITRGPNSLTFRSKQCNVLVTYRDHHLSEVIFGKRYMGKVKGLCGNCDGNKQNDYLLADGTQVPADRHRNAKIGDSYKEPPRTGVGNPAVCEGTFPSPDGPSCEGETKVRAEAMCKLLDEIDGPFGKCIQGLVPVAQRTKAGCVTDVCAFLDNPQVSRNMVCKSCDSLVESCEEAGIDVDEWRSSAGCGIKCGENSAFMDSATSCPATCEDPNPNQDADHCVVISACVCLKGFILSGGKCIPKDQCGCKKNKNYYPLNSEWLTNNCRKFKRCIFDDGRGRPTIKTSNHRCPDNAHCGFIDGKRACKCNKNYNKEGDKCVKDEDAEKEEEEKEEEENSNNELEFCKCNPWGDPHYIQFNGKTLHYQGACHYLVSGTPDGYTGDCPFAVKALNEHRRKDDVTITTIVYIETGGHIIKIGRRKQLTVNGQVRTPPVDLQDGTKVVQSGNFYKVIIPKCKIQIGFDGISKMEIKAPKDLADILVGLCGSCKREDRRKYLLANGTNVAHLKERSILVGNSFQVPSLGGVPDHESCRQTEPEKPCPADVMADIRSEKKCGRFVKPDGDFAQCLNALGISTSQTPEYCEEHDMTSEGGFETTKEITEMSIIDSVTQLPGGPQCAADKFGYKEGNVLFVKGGCAGKFKVCTTHGRTSNNKCFLVDVDSWHYKYAELRVTQVKQIHTVAVKDKRSDSECRFKHSYGVKDKNVLWVNKGCRAKFIVCDIPDDAVEELLSSCAIDICAYHEDPAEMEKQLCNAAEALADLCASKGVTVTWRKPGFCGVECPEHSTYTPSMRGCQPTCMQPLEPDTCELSLVEGCKCDEGYLLDRGKCIQHEDCGCIDPTEGYIPRDTTVVSLDCSKVMDCKGTELGAVLGITEEEHGECDQNAHCVHDEREGSLTCECNDGFVGNGYDCDVEPPPDPTPPTPITPKPETGDPCKCQASGDPEVKQHDHGFLEVSEPCKFTFSGTSEYPFPGCNECDFRVEIKNIIHPNHIDRAFINTVDVALPTVVIRLGQAMQVWTSPNTFSGNPAEARPPATWTELDIVETVTFRDEATIRKTAATVQVVTICGVLVEWDGINHLNVTVHSDYREKLIGVCGNCDYDAHNDRLYKDMTVEEISPNDHFQAYKLIASQNMVIDDSFEPELGPRCIPPAPTAQEPTKPHQP